MLVIYAGIGVLAVKIKLINHDGLGVLSKLIMKILLPVLIFTNTINGATKEEFFSSIPVMYVTIVMYLCLFILSLTIALIFRMKGNEKNVFRACTMFGNIGFMGIPIAAALFPKDGMLYVALFTIIDQLLLWTLGLALTHPVGEKEQKRSLLAIIKPMINPATVGVAIAFIAIMFGWNLPPIINGPLTKLGACATPLALIYLGGLFCYTDVLSYLKRGEIYCSIIVKMLLFPIAFFNVLSLVPSLNQDIIVFITIFSSLPTMTSIPMFAKSQNSAGEYAAGYIFLTTVCSIITLPLICIAIG